MQKDFNSSASANGAEQALKSWGIDYAKQPDGSLVVPGNIDISSKGLTRLPDLSKVEIRGSVYCDGNRLTSLKGAPNSVGGNFYCHNNQLTSLEHAPHDVGGGFSCDSNYLTSLEHAPHAVGGDFCCHNNQLTSLEHAPQSVSGSFYCENNQLTSLEHAPQNLSNLTSDFGEFTSWDAVPLEHRTSPETKARLEWQQAEQLALDIHRATVLQFSLRISGPLSFKRPTHAG